MAAAAATRADIERLTDRYIATMNRHDPKGLASLYAPNCRIDSPLFSAIHGRPAAEESFREWFRIFPDVEFKLETAAIDPPNASITTLNTATHEGDLFGLPASHKKVEFRTVRVVTFGDGLITTERRIYDFTGLLVQLGVLRAKPAKP
jgi:steroid delta-isomerase-like uncharacterized protein